MYRRHGSYYELLVIVYVRDRAVVPVGQEYGYEKEVVRARTAAYVAAPATASAAAAAHVATPAVNGKLQIAIGCSRQPTTTIGQRFIRPHL